LDNLPKVSIIVPVYNGEQKLDRCIQSLIKQTLEDIEIILINDGSTDNSGEICDRYSAIDNRIVVYHIANSGVSNARNMGLDKARGKYIGFVDSDDYIDSNMYKLMYGAVVNNDIDMCIVSHYVVTSSGIYAKELFCGNKTCSSVEIKRNIIPYYFGRGEKNLLKFGGFVWRNLYKKEIVKNIRFDESIKLMEDTIFNIEVLSNINTLITLNIPMYYYCIDDASATNKYRNDYLEQVYLISQRLYDISSSGKININYIQDNLNNTIFDLVVYGLKYVKNDKCALSHKERIAYIRRLVGVLKDKKDLKKYRIRNIKEYIFINMCRFHLYKIIYYIL
jgi:glycosyltransferase involved in cell wall biosynthesis